MRSLLLRVLPPLLALVLPSLAQPEDRECRRRFYDQDSFVCVCRLGRADCDPPAPLGLDGRRAVLFSTSRDGDRLTRSELEFGRAPDADLTLTLQPGRRLQKVFGFGGAVTDAVAAHYHASRHDLDELLRLYFGQEGIGYSMVRVPVGSCDFSESEWSHAEVADDFQLKHFDISNDKKVAVLRRVLRLENRTKLFSAAWAAPGWMKTTGRMKGGGQLKGQFNGLYYLAYARYLLRFFAAYARAGLTFWAASLLNEPGAGLNAEYGWQGMYLSAEMQRDFAQVRLGPMLRNFWATKHTLIMAHDDQRDGILEAARKIYLPNITHVDGLGVHWYSDAPYSLLSRVHELQPDKFILPSEASNAVANDEHVPLLGRWLWAERYAHDIIGNLNNFANGWVEWNLFLDEEGGPNWVGNFCDAPVLLNTSADSDEYYKQPTYYVIGQFSKFVEPDSVRVGLRVEGKADPLEAVPFETPQGNLVLVLHNPSEQQTFRAAVREEGAGANATLSLTVGPKSVKTLVWRKRDLKARRANRTRPTGPRKRSGEVGS